MQDGNYSLVSSFQKVVCQGCGSGNDGGLEKGSGNHINLVRKRIPSFNFWCHDTFVNSFSWGVGLMWSSPNSMDVSYWKVFENLEWICGQ